MREEIPYLHYVRVVACFMVVMLHCLPHPEPYTMNYYFTVLVQFFTRPCVPLFFMVSGVLLLPYAGDNIQQYYKKRLMRIVSPLLIWGVVYAFLPYLTGDEDKQEMLHNLLMVPLTYPPKIGGILWFMYIILGIYMIIPFINPRVFDSKKAMHIYLGLWGLSTIVMLIQCYYPQLLGMTQFCDINMLVYFSGYLGYLFLGKYIHQHCSHIKHRKHILALLPMGYALNIIAIYLMRDHTNQFIAGGFLTIPAILMSGAMFLLIKMLITSENPWGYVLIKKISRLSYGIYLSHMTVYTLITSKLWGGVFPIWEQVLVMILTFIVSCIFSFILAKLPFSKYTIGV